MLWKRLHKLLLVFFIVSFPLFATAGETYGELQLKAAITYNVAKFVKWPAETFSETSTPLVVCVMGNSKVASAFESLEGQFLGQRRIHVNYLKSISDCQGGHVLYIANSKDYLVNEALTALQGKPVLTVSDIESFASRGGMISLLKVRKNIRFAINLDASKSAGLQISSKLHPLATEVIRSRN
ncbi:MAG: YfiR family protein [Desulfuromusa sp.]